MKIVASPSQPCLLTCPQVTYTEKLICKVTRKENIFDNLQWESKTWFSNENSSLGCASFLVFTTKLCCLFFFSFFFLSFIFLIIHKEVKEKHQCVCPRLTSHAVEKSIVGNILC